jgi:nucleotide-binding universal stress UspA family protein
MALIHRILVATDFSDSARGALDHGGTLAAQLGVPLVLLHVYVNPVVVAPDGYMMATLEDPAAMRGQLEAALARLRSRARELGARSVEVALGEGTPWSEIIRIARERQCDLIVMGTHGHSGLSHFLLGSVAEKVVRKAEVPVLIVRSTEAAR